MTNLILPPSYQNPTLAKNLNAFFQRYPYERSRLELLLSEPVDNRQAVRVELPACPSKPPMRILLMAGIGSPGILADVFNDSTVKTETFQIFVIENDLAFLRYMFQYTDISQAIHHPKFEWMLLHNSESIKPAFFRVLKREQVASMMNNVYVIQTDLPTTEEAKAFYSELHNIYNETTQHVMHNFGRIGDSLDGVRATLMNKKAILENPGITDLKNAFRGIPALIVGAGPSLDKELANIKKNNDKFVVIAADAALKPLLKAGIRVDYCTSIERLNNYQKPFFEGLENLTTELVAFPVVLPSQFDLYPGKIRLVYRNYSYFAYFEKSWPKSILKCGGSTSHLALRLADWMGCNKIFLIGIDSCYEKAGDLYRSHCSNTGHSEWGEFIELNAFSEKRRHTNPIIGTSNSNEDVLTNLTYYQWSKEFTEELAEIGHRTPITNCAKDGLKIEGIPYRDFSQIAAQLDPQEIKPPVTEQVTYYRKWDHKVVLKQLESWYELCEKSLEQCEVILASPANVDLNNYEALMFIYNFKMAIDSMFVAFVVQCCAKEFFELENKFAALDLRWEVDAYEKTAVLKGRFTLFKDVLGQLIAIFKEVGDGQQVYKFSDN